MAIFSPAKSIAAISAVFLATAAHATTPFSPATGVITLGYTDDYSGQIGGGPQKFYAGSPISLSYSDAYESALGTLTGSPDPTLEATVSSSYIPYVAASFGSADVTLTYYFEIVGPSAVNVPVDVSAILSGNFSGNTNGGQYTSSGVSLLVDGVGYNTATYVNLNDECSGYSDPAASCSFSQNYANAIDIPSNTLISVGLGVGTAAAYGASAAGKLDPSFQIDQSFAQSNSGYSIVVSPTIGNPSAIPEPGTWVLFIVGLGSLGAVARSRRRVLSI